MKAIQCRMARAALGLGVREIAAIAQVSPDTIARLERGDTLRDRTVDVLKTAFERVGVEFINHGGAGVRLPNQVFSALSAIAVYTRIHRDGQNAPNAKLDRLIERLDKLTVEARRRRIIPLEFDAIHGEMAQLGASATSDMVSAVVRATMDQSLLVFVAEQAGKPLLAFEAHSFKIANEIFREPWFRTIRACNLSDAKIRSPTINEANWFRDNQSGESLVLFFDCPLGFRSEERRDQ
jgi:transcriptional regulator with XRE-family HTH domain